MHDGGGGAEEDEPAAVDVDDDGELVGRGWIGDVEAEPGFVEWVKGEVFGDGDGQRLLASGSGRRDWEVKGTVEGAVRIQRDVEKFHGKGMR